MIITALCACVCLREAWKSYHHGRLNDIFPTSVWGTVELLRAWLLLILESNISLYNFLAITLFYFCSESSGWPWWSSSKALFFFSYFRLLFITLSTPLSAASSRLILMNPTLDMAGAQVCSRDRKLDANHFIRQFMYQPGILTWYVGRMKSYECFNWSSSCWRLSLAAWISSSCWLGKPLQTFFL